MMTGVSTLKTPKSLITAVSVSNASGQVDKREMNRDERDTKDIIYPAQNYLESWTGRCILFNY
jgi:hypothetical protein